MMEELRQVDTSAIEELGELKQEQEILGKRLDQMEDKRGQVSDEVFARVHQDYQNRLDMLEDQARPLKEQARAEYAKLKEIYDRIERATADAALDKEELELRHDLGEFQEGEFKEKLEELELALDEREQQLAEATKLRERFIAAFPSEADLEAELPEPSPPPPPPAEEPEEEEAPGAEPPPDATSPIPVGTTEPQPEGSTMLIRWPKLIGQGEDGATVEYPVSANLTTLGRAPESDIVLSGGQVAPSHAQVSLTSQGYVIRSLEESAELMVNGQPVTERLLANGDSIQIGDVVLVFMEI